MNVTMTVSVAHAHSQRLREGLQETHKVAACQTSCAKSYWISCKRKNLQAQGALFVYKDCRSKDCRPHDTHMYNCAVCVWKVGSADLDVISF